MRLFIISYFSLLTIPAVAQSNIDSTQSPLHDTLRINQSGIGIISDFHGRVYKPNEMMYLMKDHPQAYEVMNRAKTHFILSNLLILTAIPLIAYPFLSPLVDSRHNWKLVTLGGGMVTLFIWQWKMYGKLLNEAVNVYNSIPSTSATFKVSTGFTSNGIGVSIGF